MKSFATYIVVTGVPDMPIRGDGKQIGLGELRLEVAPGAVRVIVPSGGQAPIQARRASE